MKSFASTYRGWLSVLVLAFSGVGCGPQPSPEASQAAALSTKEVLHQRWQAGGWHDYARSLVVYDSTSRPVQEVEMRFQDGAWTRASRQTYRHEGGNLVETLREEWVGGGWRKESRRALHYDERGRLQETAREVWAWYDEVWFEAGREEHSYAGEGRTHTTLVQRPTYDDEGYQARLGERPGQEPAWSNGELVTQQLGAGESVLEEVTQRWREAAWVNNQKTVHSYDEAGRRVQTQFYVWQDTTWAPGLRTTYNEQEDGTREAVVQRQADDGWVNATRTLERSGSGPTSGM